jgi:hypothetical protein
MATRSVGRTATDFAGYSELLAPLILAGVGVSLAIPAAQAN